MAPASSGTETCQAQRRARGDATAPVSITYAYRFPTAARRASKPAAASTASITRTASVPIGWSGIASPPAGSIARSGPPISRASSTTPSAMRWLCETITMPTRYQLTRAAFLRVVGEYDIARQDDLRDDGRTELPIVIRDDVTGLYRRALERIEPTVHLLRRLIEHYCLQPST